MKIVLINHSDSKGGASVVTRRLMHALRAAGHDARMLVTHKATDDGFVELAAPHWRSRLTFYGECLHIAMGNGFDRSTLFKLSVASDGLPLWRHPLVRKADVIMLNWVNQGMLSYHGLRRLCALGKPVIWTMHDMWCMVGACHHAGECVNYHRQCGCCPVINSNRPHDLTYRSWLAKNAVYEDARIHFVAVSHWLAGKAAHSLLLKDRPVSVIPNAFPVTRYLSRPAFSRSELGLPDGRLVVMGAARLDDPVKDLPKAIETLNLLADRGVAATAVFYGWIRERNLLDSLRLPYVYMGTISDPERIQAVYGHADAVLSSSVYETLPGTLIEGQAAGALPVSFGQGGQSDIIDHLHTGYIAGYGDAADLANGLEWALSPQRGLRFVAGDDESQPCAELSDRQAAQAAVAARFDAQAVAARYIELCRSMLDRLYNKR